MIWFQYHIFIIYSVINNTYVLIYFYTIFYIKSILKKYFFIKFIFILVFYGIILRTLLLLNLVKMLKSTSKVSLETSTPGLQLKSKQLSIWLKVNQNLCKTLIFYFLDPWIAFFCNLGIFLFINKAYQVRTLYFCIVKSII